jgi:hypothetical protein
MKNHESFLNVWNVLVKGRHFRSQAVVCFAISHFTCDIRIRPLRFRFIPDEILR